MNRSFRPRGAVSAWFRRSAALVAAIALVTFSPAPAVAASKKAAPADTTGDRLQAAWVKVVGYASGFLDEPQQKQLYDIAYAAAVPGVCSDFGVDRVAVEKGFEKFDTPALRKLDPREQHKFEQQLLATYGVAVGLLLADGSLHEREFCDYARRQRSEPVGRYWLPEGAKAEASSGPAVGSPRPPVPAAALPPAQSPRVLSAPSLPTGPR